MQDGRKLLINSSPGDVTIPTVYDPFAAEEDNAEWTKHTDSGCGLDPMAQAELDDVEKLKQVISKGQLKGKGIGAFCIQCAPHLTPRGYARDQKSRSPLLPSFASPQFWVMMR